MIEKDRELIAGDVVPAAGEQDREKHLAVTEQFFNSPGKLLELSFSMSHVLDAVAHVRNRFDIVEVVVLEQAQHVLHRIVEPGIALCDQHSDGFSRSE